MARRKARAPASAHYGLLDDRCFETAARVVRLLEARGATYVLAGGWAVYAYGSRVPSVDTDVLLDERDGPTLAEAVLALGVTVGPDEQFEPLPLDGPSNVLGPDPELGEPDRGYVPRALLAGGTVRRDLDLAEHGRITATVPSADALAFMKLKAYHNRELQWRAHRDPAVMSRIPTGDRGQVLAKTETYFYRKAGKDLYDVAFLLARHADEVRVLDLAAQTGLDADLEPLLARAPSLPLLLFARSMAEEEADWETLGWLARLGAR